MRVAPLVLGTRGSRLALVQAEAVGDLLRRAVPGLRIEVKTFRTSGDHDQTSPLDDLGARGAFVGEIERALMAGEIDLAVHSLKDLPVDAGGPLVVAAVPQRADARDAWVCPARVSLEALPQGSVVGTSSLRRAAQVRRARSDLRILPLRGNVDTRIRKVERGEYDAIVVAMAGLERLGMVDRVTRALPAEDFVPAPGQGALAVQVRRDDAEIAQIACTVNHPPSASAVAAERAFLRRLGGGCRLPAGAYADVRQGRLSLIGYVADVQGRRHMQATREGAADEAEDLGVRLAEVLLERGARAWIEEASE